MKIKNFLGFTGVDQAYEKPDAPELVLKTIHLSIEESTMQVVQMLEENVSNYIHVKLCSWLVGFD